MAKSSLVSKKELVTSDIFERVFDRADEMVLIRNKDGTLNLPKKNEYVIWIRKNKSIFYSQINMPIDIFLGDGQFKLIRWLRIEK